jgi:hypothetical protein
MKTEHKELVRARAERAIENLYHNATLPYIQDLHGRTEDQANSWLQGACEFEIEYLADGGSTPGDYRATLAHPANAGRYKSAAARDYYVRKGMRDRDLERADCGAMTGWKHFELACGNVGVNVDPRARGIDPTTMPCDIPRHNAQWERIGEFGKLCQWGRGGRTLAPADLVQTHGGSGFSLKTDCSDRSIADCIELIRIVESFNAYVESWCASVPEQWRDYCADEDAQALADKRAASARKAKETRERNYWNARDVQTVGAA